MYILSMKFKHIYVLKSLDDYNGYCESAIRKLNDDMQKVLEYQRNLNEHRQIVLSTPTKKVVIIDRRCENYRTNKKEFTVSVEEVPQIEYGNIDGNWIISTHIETQKFQGRERHKAIKYAEELAAKYNCEIKRTGSWK